MDLYATAHGTDIPVNRDVVCPRCRCLTRWLRNYGGKTVCISCALTEEECDDEVARCGKGSPT